MNDSEKLDWMKRALPYIEYMRDEMTRLIETEGFNDYYALQLLDAEKLIAEFNRE